MVALQIRGVSEDVRRTLAERARARGQSLQAFLLALVKDEALRATNEALINQFVGRHDGSKLSVDEATDALDRARDERSALAGDDATDAQRRARAERTAGLADGGTSAGDLR